MCTEMSSKRGGVETDIRLIASTFIKSLKHEVVPAKRRRNVECPICLEPHALSALDPACGNYDLVVRVWACWGCSGSCRP